MINTKASITEQISIAKDLPRGGGGGGGGENRGIATQGKRGGEGYGRRERKRRETGVLRRGKRGRIAKD